MSHHLDRPSASRSSGPGHVDELRAVARGIYPAVLAECGLGGAVQALAVV